MVLKGLLVALVVTPPVQDTWTVSLKPAQGETHIYDLKLESMFGTQAIEYSAKMTETVTKLAENGNVTVSSVHKDGQLKIDGSVLENAVTDGATSVTTRKPNGLLVSVSGDGVAADSVRVAHLTNIVWPDRAVREKDSWEQAYDADTQTGAIKSKVTFTCLGLANVNEKQCIKVIFEGVELDGDKPASVRGTQWVDPATGLLIKADWEFSNFPIAQSPLTGKVSLSIVP